MHTKYMTITQPKTMTPSSLCRVFLLLLLCTLTVSCGNKKEEEIKDSTESGVVLIQNQSYYEMEMPNGNSIYFSALDSEGDICGVTADRDSVEYATTYGTGFFVGKDGKIATNAHVVSNYASDKEINKSMTKIIHALRDIVAEAYYDLKTDYNKVVQLYNYARFSPEVSYADYYRVQALKEAAEEELERYEAIYYALDDFKASDCDIKYHSQISIAYNDTFVTNTDDFIPCVVTQSDDEHDLAIIQLKDKKTPEGRCVFTIPEEDPLENYSLMEKLTKKIHEDKNSKLYMVGFNLGPVLAITDEGIKSQFNSGTISQTQNSKIMYSIPALHGSSGSPVVNLQGQLVAINYAGLNGTQNFNYGIRVKYLRNLMDK